MADNKKFDDFYSESLYTLMSRSYDGFVPSTPIKGASGVADIRALGDRMMEDHVIDAYTVAGTNAIQCIGFEKGMAIDALSNLEGKPEEQAG